jgi:hypothetical protein
MSDDDTLEEDKNLLNELLDTIKKTHFEQMIVNFKVYDKSLKNIINNTPLKFIKKDIIFNNNKDFLNWIINNDRYSSMLLFMSIRIFKKSFWFKNINSINKINKNPTINLHPHSSILISNIEKQKIIIKNKQYIKARSDNFSWDNS